MTKTIGIVIPAFNAERTLRQAVASVRAQIHENWHLIVVDDGSHRSQAEILGGLVNDPRIEVMRLERNVGAAQARNMGLSKLDHDWIAFLDADDIWLPEKLDQQIRFIERAAEPIDLCATGYVYRKYIGSGPRAITWRCPEPADDYRGLVFGCDFSPGSTLLVRRTVFERIGLFDPGLRRFEDWDWLLRATLGGFRIVVAPQANVIVNNMGWPSFPAVRAGVVRLARRHSRAIARRSWLDVLRFRSSLILETAGAAWRQRRRLAALTMIVQSLAVWPFRDRVFFLRALSLLFLRDERVDRRKGTGRPRSILHVISGLGVGGAEAMLVELVHALEQRGIRQYVVAMRSGGRYGDVLRDAIGERYVALDLEGIRQAPRAVFDLARILWRVRPSIVQSWMYHGDLAALMAHAVSFRRSDAKLFWCIRCSDLDLSRYSRQLKMVVRLCRLASPFVDGILVNSDAGLFAHSRAGFANARMLRVPNCVDTDRFRPDPEARRRVREALGIAPDVFVFGIVARCDPMKGYEVFTAVAEAMPECVALAVGLGTERIDGPDNFFPLGLRDDVPDLLRAMDALVSTSHFGEGTSNSILEGMATGLPIVATDVGDAAGIVGSGGRIVRPGDVDAIVSALEELKRNPELARRLGAHNRAVARSKYSREAMVDAFLDAYRQVL